MKEYSANLVSNGKKYAIVVARFNHFITDRLVEGCLDTLKRHEVKDEEIELQTELSKLEARRHELQSSSSKEQEKN